MWRQLELLNSRWFGTDLSSNRPTLKKDSDGACTLNPMRIFLLNFRWKEVSNHTSFRLIKQRRSCQIWKNVFVLKIKRVRQFLLQFKPVSKESAKLAEKKTICINLLLHLQNLSLYLSHFKSVIFSGSDALFFEFSLKVFCFSWFFFFLPIFIIVMENQFDKINLEDLFFTIPRFLWLGL